jgi:hypothetical protein
MLLPSAGPLSLGPRIIPRLDPNPDRFWTFWIKRLDFGCEVSRQILAKILDTYIHVSGQDLITLLPARSLTSQYSTTIGVYLAT